MTTQLRNLIATTLIIDRNERGIPSNRQQRQDRLAKALATVTGIHRTDINVAINKAWPKVYGC